MAVTSRDVEKGTFMGTYCSAVGNAEHEYDLVGRFDIVGQTLGWVVTFRNQHLNAHSTCAWSGKIELKPGDQKNPIMHTTWLLARQTDSEDDWNSTNVGFDAFTGNRPTEEQILLAKQRRQSSHPKSV